MSAREIFTHIGPAIGSRLVMLAETFTNELFNFVSPYVHMRFPEFSGAQLKHSEVFVDIENYLTKYVSSHARRLKVDSMQDGHSLILSMDENEGVSDEFEGVKVWWYLRDGGNLRMHGRSTYYYQLKFHQKHRKLITESYIKHVLTEGKAVGSMNKKHKLYTIDNRDMNAWSHVTFEHPATFETLAMEPIKKQAIMDDLKKFAKSKDYYTKIGKPWKRGYLLDGPPGTGKSTMVAAMSNLLNYNVYDVELTAVRDNSHLKKLLVETSGKSIIVIEDIDCSLDLTGERKSMEKDNGDENRDLPRVMTEKWMKRSRVTLSGLLNFIDGIWSTCGGEERIIVLTTNHVEKLDPGILRRGRMDKHIEMPYCSFEAFKVLAKNYLEIETHGLYATIRQLIEEVKMSPADVAENLIPKSDEEGVEARLNNLKAALEVAKEEAKKKTEEEETLLKAENEEKEKEPNAGGKVKQGGTSVKENGVIIDGEVASKEVEKERKRRNQMLEETAARKVKRKSSRRN